MTGIGSDPRNSDRRGAAAGSPPARCGRPRVDSPTGNGERHVNAVWQPTRRRTEPASRSRTRRPARRWRPFPTSAARRRAHRRRGPRRPAGLGGGRLRGALAAILMAARAWMVANGDRVVETICGETGRPADETQFAELSYGISALEFWAKHASVDPGRRGRRDRLALVRGGRKLKVRYAPVGVVGVIGPWNYPLNNSFGDCIPALTAGNAVVLKPSEVTPLTSLLMAEMLAEAGMPEGVFTVATGTRRDRRRPGRPRRLRDVHGLGRDRQEGDGAGGRDADAGQPRARRQGPDDRPRRRRHRARRQRRRQLRPQQLRPGLHLGRADLRRGRGPRRVRRSPHGEGRGAAAGSARRARQRRRRRDHLPAPARADRRPRPRRGRSRCRAEDRRPDRRRTGSLLRADGADRGRPLDALHDRGDVRADAAGDEGRRRRGGRRPGQRGQLRSAGIGLDPRHRSRRGDRPADRGGGRVRQRRAAELRGAGAADGRLEAVRARLPPRPRRDPQVHASASRSS